MRPTSPPLSRPTAVHPENYISEAAAPAASAAADCSYLLNFPCEPAHPL